jgi:hypothetical protein
MKKTIAQAFIVASLALGITATAFAADTGDVQIARIAPWSTGTQLQISSKTFSCPAVNGLPANSGNQLNIPNGGPETQHGRNFQIALAAVLANKTVNINWACATTDNKPTVIAIRM